MRNAILFLLVLAACGSNPDAPVANGNVETVGTSDGGTTASVSYLDGRDGKDGVNGKDGAQGIPGDIGPQGPQGIPGDIGPQGPQGIPGADSTVPGPQGLVGPMGLTGPQGLQGAQGPQGVAGTPGAVGAVGPQGPKGADGTAGAAGLQGPQGVAGSTGAQGPQGVAGLNGSGGYWVDSTGAVAPIVGATTPLYVTPEGYMYEVSPMTGRLSVHLEDQDMTDRRFVKGAACAGQGWYLFNEESQLKPMLAFRMRPQNSAANSTYAFKRDVQIAADVPATFGSVYANNTAACGGGVVAPPTLITTGTYPNQAYWRKYYVDSTYLVMIPDPNQVVVTTKPPYRFVPTL
jgi:hypothetical protein